MSTTTATALKFRRDDLGFYNARFTAERDLLFDNGEVMTTVTESVTFRLLKSRKTGYGWRLIIFAGGVIIYDDDDIETFKFGKLFAARLADVPFLQEIALNVLVHGASGMRYNTPASLANYVRHEPYMLALDDFYGPSDRIR